MRTIQKSMNWDAISFDWNHIRAFLATVEQGSLSAAARTLRQTQPTLSRQITSLEEALDLTLFERGKRQMQLTASGHELLVHVQQMAGAAAQISRVATGQNQTVEGTVRITSSDAMAAYILPRHVIDLRRRHPGIAIELMPSNALTDLTLRDADIAIRHVRPEQPDLVAKRLPDLVIGLLASQSYLDAFGPILGPPDTAHAQFIGFERRAQLVPQLKAMGLPVTEANFGITTNNGCSVYELTRGGAGIALLPVAMAGAPMGLVQVLPDLPPISVPTWLVTHREIRTSRRIRIVFDHLVEGLTRAGWTDHL